MRIYVAGPYSPSCHDHNNCIKEVEMNVRHAITVGNELIRRGHTVFVPHLSHYQANAPNGRHDWPWYEMDNTFIDHWAEALFYIAPSIGADAERARAEKRGLKIYTKLNDVPNAEPH
jgi:hypothetical protein